MPNSKALAKRKPSAPSRKSSTPKRRKSSSHSEDSRTAGSSKHTSAASSRRGTGKETKDNQKKSLADTESRLAELMAAVEAAPSPDDMKRQEREIEALSLELETQEGNRKAELAALKEAHRQQVEEAEATMRSQKSAYDAEKQGYLHSIGVLFNSCEEERLKREEDRVRYISQIGGLQVDEEWLTQMLHVSQDRKWLDFSSEGSNEEYNRLWKLYGHHLRQREVGLLAFWRALQQDVSESSLAKLRPSQIRLLLSRESNSSLTFRVGSSHHMELGGTVVLESEVTGFTSNVLAHVGNLKHLAILDCPVSPFDWDAMSPCKTLFPTLQSFALWHTQLTAHDVMELVRRLPELRPCGFQSIVNGVSLHESCLDLQNYTLDELTQNCGRKLWVWGALVCDVSRVEA